MNAPSSRSGRQKAFRFTPGIVAALLIAIACVRMAATYRVFSATNDEATHVGAGLELIQFHRYLLQRENPPLPRLVFAAIPYLSGMRVTPSTNFGEELASVFYGHGDYVRNLVLARCGNLLFFILGAICVWFLARAAIGEKGALLAVFLFTMEPIVLGYQALATHDAAGLAGTALALLAFDRWMRRTTIADALLFGGAYAFAIACKFSCIPYVPAAVIAMMIVRLLHDRPLRQRFWRKSWMVAPAATVTLLALWALYAFTTRPRFFITPWLASYPPRLAALFMRIPDTMRVPAPDFLIGIGGLLSIDQHGMTSYALGKTTTSGWWWYFPFAALMKTTLIALALIVAGAFVTKRELRWTWLEHVAAALAILAVACTSTLDIGVRYVLPMYAPLSVAAAATLVSLLQRGIAAKRIAVAAIIVQIVVSLAAHPDYFPYFNALAGRDPSRALVDSNLDWGQDILRLRHEVRKEKMTTLGISLMGPADYRKLNFPPLHGIDPINVTHGWVAVSDQAYRAAGIETAWWLPKKPTRRVGKSIRLFYVP